MTRRVAITGMGVVSALGHDTASFWESLSAGRPAIGPIEGIDLAQFRFQNGAQVRGFNPLNHWDAKQADQFDPFSQYAIVAARQAMAQSVPGDLGALGPRAGIVTGSCVGGQSTEDAGFYDIYALKRPRSNPMTIPRVMANAAASAISVEFGVRGPSFTISTACASSNHALGQAYWMVRSGMLEVALSGGSEAVFSHCFLKAWESMRVVAPDTCRPFSKDRKGLILGEGSAIFVLEPLERARARGATVLAEIVGCGMSADAHHITQPSQEGPAAAMQAALEDGGIAPESVAYINAHGTGTPANDPTETKAIRAVFGEHADRLAVSSTKSMHGHALGAAGALEAAATVLALRCQHAPPTANYSEVDPDCDLDIVPNVGRRMAIEYALSNGFAFGGLNAVVAFRAAQASGTE